MQGSDSNLIAQNESHDNVEDGILVLSSNGNSVERNRATGNGVSGIAVIWVAQTMVGRNVSDANGQWGFSALVTDGSRTVIAQNSACGNGNADGVDFGPNNQIFGHFAPASWTNNEFCTPLRYFWEAEGG